MIGSVSYVGMNVRVWYVHVLWECPVYGSIGNTFMGELDKLLGGGGGGGVLRSLVHLIILIGQAFILGCENWDRYDFKALLKLVKSFVLLVWDTRKNKLYGDQDGTTPVALVL